MTFPWNTGIAHCTRPLSPATAFLIAFCFISMLIWPLGLFVQLLLPRSLGRFFDKKNCCFMSQSLPPLSPFFLPLCPHFTRPRFFIYLKACMFVFCSFICMSLSFLDLHFGFTACRSTHTISLQLQSILFAFSLTTKKTSHHNSNIPCACIFAFCYHKRYRAGSNTVLTRCTYARLHGHIDFFFFCR